MPYKTLYIHILLQNKQHAFLEFMTANLISKYNKYNMHYKIQLF